MVMMAGYDVVGVGRCSLPRGRIAQGRLDAGWMAWWVVRSGLPAREVRKRHHAPVEGCACGMGMRCRPGGE